MRGSVVSRAAALVLLLLGAIAATAQSDPPVEMTTQNQPHAEWTSEWIPGTECSVEYGLGDSEPVQCGDLVELRCRFFAAGDTTRACDSLVVSARAGSTDLPLGVNWLLLGLGWQPVNWDRPITLPRELLDRRFTRCADARGLYVVRISIAHADQLVTPDQARRFAPARQAIAAYREKRYQQAIPEIGALVKSQPKSPLWHALYGGLVYKQGLCTEYERQAVALARLTGTDLMYVRERALKSCDGARTLREEERKGSR